MPRRRRNWLVFVSVVTLGLIIVVGVIATWPVKPEPPKIIWTEWSDPIDDELRSLGVEIDSLADRVRDQAGQ